MVQTMKFLIAEPSSLPIRIHIMSKYSPQVPISNFLILYSSVFIIIIIIIIIRVYLALETESCVVSSCELWFRNSTIPLIKAVENPDECLEYSWIM